MNLLESILSFQDPLLTFTAIISVISLIFIAVLSYYYKKLKDQEVISEIISTEVEKENSSPTETKLQKFSSEQHNLSSFQPTKKVVKTEQSVYEQNYEIIMAQISELSNQINSLNNYIKEIASVINNVQKSSDTKDFSEETIKKLISSLEKVHNDINLLMKSNSVSTTQTIDEINNKLDNLLKLLSTLLQQ
ncbi:MAG: hypothetical protein ACK4WJ_00660 [Endomicrobiia bacterium]